MYSFTPLYAVSPSVSASSALIVSTLVGSVSERFVSNIGILVTLLTAAALSNLRLVPIVHPVYDLCWNVFLPASLAFLLLSSSLDEHNPDGSGASSSSVNNNVQVIKTVKTVAVPFCIGSIGSIVGCITSFLICARWPTLWLPSSPTSDAAIVAASCLCASYIGGSVNFFATASHVLSSSSINNDLITSMATADLMVMAIYFVFLTAALQSKRLQQLFGDDGPHDDENTITSLTNNDVNMDFELDDNVGTHSHNHMPRGDAVVATISVSLLAFPIVHIANRVESYVASALHLPGTACAAIALLTTLVPKIVANKSDAWKRMQRRAAGSLSQICFYLFFASLGMSANIGNALKNGPACLWFSMTALCIHVMITLGGSLVWKRISNNKNGEIQLQHVLVASNAAIGGPATAAAFCSQVPNMAQGLTLAATVWGVTGYAVGTSIGVALSRLLSRMII
jgi:uncharacterized membrane protein